MVWVDRGGGVRDWSDKGLRGVVACRGEGRESRRWNGSLRGSCGVAWGGAAAGAVWSRVCPVGGRELRDGCLPWNRVPFS